MTSSIATTTNTQEHTTTTTSTTFRSFSASASKRKNTSPPSTPLSHQPLELASDTLYFDAVDSFASCPSPQKKSRNTRNKLKQAGIELPSPTRTQSTRSASRSTLPPTPPPSSIAASPALKLNAYQVDYKANRSNYIKEKKIDQDRVVREKRLVQESITNNNGDMTFEKFNTATIVEQMNSLDQIERSPTVHNAGMVDVSTTDETMDELNTAVIDEPMNVADTVDELYYFERQHVCLNLS
jgi:hypothetical protein